MSEMLRKLEGTLKGRSRQRPCRTQDESGAACIDTGLQDRDTSSTELATMSLTLEFTSGDFQASKACIAAALAEVAIKLHASKPGSAPSQLLLSPVDLTQPNAIAQYIGLPQLMLSA